MAQESPIPPRLRELSNAVFEELATKDQLEELQRILQTDEQARKIYLNQCRTHVGLYFAAREQKMLARAVDAIADPKASAGKLPAEPTKVSPTKSPVLGFLGGAIDYVNHSRMLMFWLVALLVGGWFAFQLGSLMMGRAHPAAPGGGFAD